MAWVLDTLCTEHSDVVDLENISALPRPDSDWPADHQQNVERTVRETTVRIADATGRVDDHQKPQGVNEATPHPSAGKKVQAGMTAEPLAKQETTEDEADAITAALEAKLLEFVAARALGDKPTDEALVSLVLADYFESAMPINYCKIQFLLQGLPQYERGYP